MNGLLCIDLDSIKDDLERDATVGIIHNCTIFFVNWCLPF